MAKQVGCYLVGAAGWWSTLPTKMEDCLRIKPAERKAELRCGERQIPKDTELLDPAIPKPSFPRTFQFLSQCLPLWFKLFQVGFCRRVAHPQILSHFVLTPAWPSPQGHTRMPAVRHLSTASGTVARGGSIMDTSPAKHRPLVGKFMASTSKA